MIAGIPHLEQFAVSGRDESSVMRDTVEQVFQIAPLAVLFDFPAMKIEVSDTAVFLDIVYGVLEMFRPIPG